MTADAAEIVRLAERVEQAAGTDRQLDYAIGAITGINKVPADLWPVMMAGSKSDLLVPIYTTSLDAAMTLVPEGFMWRLQSWPDGVNSALLEKNAGDFGAIDARHTEAVAAATPALALIAAALRARAASALSDGEG